jgi:beta-glucanase (GH16 family)
MFHAGRYGTGHAGASMPPRAWSAKLDEIAPASLRWAMLAALLGAAASHPAAAAPRLTFDEEFDNFQSSPDGAVGWMTSYPYGGEAARTLPGNKEWEFYSDRSVGEVPFSNAHGMLTIHATPAKHGSNPYGLPYDSGLITTYRSFAQLYGYFAIRAKLPAGQGMWPAFWLLPANNAYSAELDVFEVLGNAPTTLYATTHGETGPNWVVNCQALQVANTSTGFHTYGVDWEPKTTTFYMDGNIIATSATPASMNTPMYMLIDLAVGGPGSWPGAPNAATHFPGAMVIDWVRVYASPNTRDISGSAALAP